ncbi:MAG: hypothetical protein WC789_06150 [Lentisphaeria bacterium]|jgi:hypothetical protein
MEGHIFFRKKKSGKYEYLQLVEGVRAGDKVRQRVLLTLGTCEGWIAGGKLDSLLASGARLSDKGAMFSAVKCGVVPARFFRRLEWRLPRPSDSCENRFCCANNFLSCHNSLIIKEVIFKVSKTSQDALLAANLFGTE